MRKSHDWEGTAMLSVMIVLWFVSWAVFCLVVVGLWKAMELLA
jgi:hypothetical protein